MATCLFVSNSLFLYVNISLLIVRLVLLVLCLPSVVLVLFGVGGWG